MKNPRFRNWKSWQTAERKNGVPGLSIVTGEAIKSLEPALSDDVKAVLVCPTGGNCMSVPDDDALAGKRCQ